MLSTAKIIGLRAIIMGWLALFVSLPSFAEDPDDFDFDAKEEIKTPRPDGPLSVLDPSRTFSNWSTCLARRTPCKIALQFSRSEVKIPPLIKTNLGLDLEKLLIRDLEGEDDKPTGLAMDITVTREGVEFSRFATFIEQKGSDTPRFIPANQDLLIKSVEHELEVNRGNSETLKAKFRYHLNLIKSVTYQYKLDNEQLVTNVLDDMVEVVGLAGTPVFTGVLLEKLEESKGRLALCAEIIGTTLAKLFMKPQCGKNQKSITLTRVDWEASDDVEKLGIDKSEVPLIAKDIYFKLDLVLTMEHGEFKTGTIAINLFEDGWDKDAKPFWLGLLNLAIPPGGNLATITDLIEIEPW
jgi:hypothetical protein